MQRNVALFDKTLSDTDQLSLFHRIKSSFNVIFYSNGFLQALTSVTLARFTQGTSVSEDVRAGWRDCRS